MCIRDRYTKQLLFLIDEYKKEYLHPSDQLQMELEETDLDFIKSDLPKILESIQTGTTRVQKIVQSLRTFSRMDEAEKKSVNIHDGIESTLLILQHRLNKIDDDTKIEIIKQYSKLSKVECYAGQLNQVFMAILVNAIESLESAFMPDLMSPDLMSVAIQKQRLILAPPIHQNPRPPTAKNGSPSIIITTYQDSKDNICIEIADNGLGMPIVTQKRLFEPFYTTKPVGQGTGLGLSMSYQIVTQNHKGSLICQSELGQGAKFIIKIPIKTLAS